MALYTVKENFCRKKIFWKNSRRDQKTAEQVCLFVANEL